MSNDPKPLRSCLWTTPVNANWSMPPEVLEGMREASKLSRGEMREKIRVHLLKMYEKDPWLRPNHSFSCMCWICVLLRGDQ